MLFVKLLSPLLLGALCFAHEGHEGHEHGEGDESKGRVHHSLSATVLDIDRTVQGTVYRSQAEYSAIILSAMKTLTASAKEIKVKEPKSVPIETKELEIQENAAEQVIRDAILEANQKLWSVFKKAVVVDQGDNKLLAALEGPARKKRHAEEHKKKHKGHIHDVDSVAHKFHDEIEEILGDCDEKVRAAHDNIFTMFAKSIETLLGDHLAEGTIDKQRDEMTAYGIQAGQKIVESHVIKIELDLGDGLVCAAKLKGADKEKLDRERARLARAIEHIQSPKADGRLIAAIKRSTMKLSKEYEDLHDVVVGDKKKKE